METSSRFAWSTQIRDRLGPAYYETDSVMLFHGDALEFLERLAGFDLDLVVTSPPYNIGKEYESSRPLDDYVAWCGRWMAASFAAVKDDGAFWLNLGYLPVPDRGKAVPLPYLLWDRSPFFLLQEVVWHYGAGVAARRSFSPRNEKWLWYVKNQESYTFDLDAVRDPDVKYPNQKKNGKLKCNPLGKNPSDVWSIPKVTSGAGRASVERTPHPAQFPTAVVDRIVRASSRPGELVLDPFVGSGSAAVAAVGAGRRALGFDTEARYLDIAIDRLERVQLSIELAG